MTGKINIKFFSDSSEDYALTAEELNKLNISELNFNLISPREL